MPASAGHAGFGRVLLSLVFVALGLFSPGGEILAQEMGPVGGAAVIVSAGDAVLLREQAGYDALVLATLGDGSGVEVTGEPVAASDGSSWLPVVAAGQSGYVPAGYVAGAPAAPGQAPANPATSSLGAPAPESASAPESSASLVADANLRTGPSAEAGVMWVVPAGTTVAVDGSPENGFVPVTADGASGWVAAELLATGTPAGSSQPAPLVAAEPAAAPPANVVDTTQRGKNREHASTGIAWPVAGGEWQVVQGYNTGSHTNRSGFAQYKYSLDWARVDGNTAGQQVAAPVSGTIQWVDRGSGGLLIDAGNGYGVVLFHLTLDRDLRSGGSVERGQRIGEISGPGGDGYMEMAHFEIGVWELTANGHNSVPFTGPNAIGGQEFPDTGGSNQYMGSKVTL